MSLTGVFFFPTTFYIFDFAFSSVLFFSFTSTASNLTSAPNKFIAFGFYELFWWVTKPASVSAEIIIYFLLSSDILLLPV